MTLSLRLREFYSPTSKIIHLKTPLPCGVTPPKNNNVCGQPATAALARPNFGGESAAWQILPICNDCRRRMLGVFAKTSIGYH